jgi:fructose-bisphosphate aldolase class I
MSEMFDHARSAKGFIAALDQSGGSTPKALKLYGIDESEYSNDTEMFDRMHEMRMRIIKSPAFNGDKVVGAILFENTMDRQIDGRGSADYLWNVKHVVPFLKVDKGLTDEADGAQLMKPMPDLDGLLERAVEAGVFGTKMRSVISHADKAGIGAVVDQQVEVARQIIGHGLVPIIEPEVDINSPTKAEAEELLRSAISDHLDAFGDDEHVMLKLTLPEVDDFYLPLIKHSNVVRVVALSGGYPRTEANAKLARNHGMIASFSRALTEGLTAQMSDEQFDDALSDTIDAIYQASIT